MILAVWFMGIFPALLILGWLDWATYKDTPKEALGSAFGVAVVFWPITFAVLIVGVVMMYWIEPSDIHTLQRRKDKDPQ